MFAFQLRYHCGYGIVDIFNPVNNLPFECTSLSFRISYFGFRISDIRYFVSYFCGMAFIRDSISGCGFLIK
jgi:hypothetical protein